MLAPRWAAVHGGQLAAKLPPNSARGAKQGRLKARSELSSYQTNCSTKRKGRRAVLADVRSGRTNGEHWVASVSAASAPSSAAVALPLAFATSLFAIAPATLGTAAVSAQLAALHPAKRSTLFRMHLWRPAVSSGRAAVVLDPPGAHAHLGCGGAAVPRVCVR